MVDVEYTLVYQDADECLIGSVMMNEASSWPENSGVKKREATETWKMGWRKSWTKWISQRLTRDIAYAWRG